MGIRNNWKAHWDSYKCILSEPKDIETLKM